MLLQNLDYLIYTKATNGSDNNFNLDNGVDNVIGSADDVRGDDVNLNYFKTVDNNPFTTQASNTYDSSTYSRVTANLPGADLFSANPDRDVATGFGVPNTEAAMQQGSFFGELQHTLGADDVAGLRFGMAGLDEVQGNADDYTLVLNYVGLDATADIVIDFDNAQTGFAVSQSGGSFLPGGHIRITTNRIFFNTGFNWFFTTVLSDGNDLYNPTSGISIFPNPANNFVTINNRNSLIIETVNVYDLNGRLLVTKSMNQNVISTNIEMDISAFESGIYLFEIKSNQGDIVQRIIKN